jgi:hypothetical protein
MTQFRIITKNRSDSGSIPPTASLQVGELAVNTGDGGLYYLHNSGTLSGSVQLVRAGRSTSSSFADTSSFATSASFAASASWAPTVGGGSGLFASSSVSSSWASSSISSSYAATASVLLGSIVSASYALTSSHAVQALSASWAPSTGGSGLFASSSVSASWASSSISSSYAATASLLLGSIVSASYALTASYALNGGILSTLSNTVGVAVWRSGSQTINGTEAVSFTTEYRDDSGFWSISPNPTRITIPSGAEGWYVVAGNVYWSGINGLGRRGLIYLNGVEVAGQSVVADADHNDPRNSATLIRYLNVGDYLEWVMSENFGGTVDIFASASLSAVRIGGTVSASYAETSSYALQALSASWAPSTGGSGLFASSSVSASWASSSLSSSYALTSSYALNGGTTTNNYTNSYTLLGGSLRTSSSVNIAGISSGSTVTGSIVLANGFIVYQLSTSDIARVRLYSSASYRNNDVTRSISQTPTGEHGLILDVVTSGNVNFLNYDLAPMPFGADLSPTPNGQIAYSITNLTAGTLNLTSSVVFVPLETTASSSPISASYALTASYALNGGSGGGSSLSSSWASQSLSSSYADRVWGGTYISGTASFSDVGVAISDAQFLVLSASSDLPNERLFAPSARFTTSDGGANGNYSLDLSNNIRTSTIGVVIDGGGVPITVGEKVDLLIPFNCQIVSWSVLVDRTGSIRVDLWKTTFEAYPPTASNLMTSNLSPFISGSVKNRSTASLSAWSGSSISKNDTIRFYVSSSATVQRANLTLEVLRS